MNEAVKALQAARKTAAEYRDDQAKALPEHEACVAQCKAEISRMDTRIKEIDVAIKKLGGPTGAKE